MKKLLIFNILVTLVLVFLIISVASARIRCGNDIISKGDSSFEVMRKLQHCGNVIYREIVEELTDGTFSSRTNYQRNQRFSNGNFQSSKTKVERWYIKINERGGDYCWNVIFIGGKLHEFEDWQKCD